MKKVSLEGQLRMEFATASIGEIGTPVDSSARCSLVKHGIDCAGKTAQRLICADCGLPIWMASEDHWKLDGEMRRVCHQILCYGDSNTYGYDPRSYLGERYPKSVRWTGLLELAGWTVINEGVNGRSIPRADWEIETAVQTIRRTGVEALVIMLGSNDLLQCPGISVEVCSDRMKLFLRNLISETLSLHQILLVAPPPMKPGAWVDDLRTLEESHRLAGCYRTLAQKLGVNFADAGEWGVELTFDGVHFSEAGHLAFAEEMRMSITGLFDV